MQKHVATKVALVKRTKKNQRRAAHRAKMAEQARLTLGDAPMTDAPGAAASTSKRKKQKGKAAAPATAAAVAAGSSGAEIMQE